VWALLAISAATVPLHASLERAQELYQRTQYREALRELEATPQKNGAAYALMGESYYHLEDYGKATEALEKAVGAEPRNSGYWNWLGKAYGRRAETSSFPISRMRHAGRTREHFEKAVSLDPQNTEALSDLFEYYLEAPGFLGGGQEKAAELSERLRSLDPARYYSMQARLAEKRKDLVQAERFYKQAVEAAPTQPGRLADLARFLARQQRFAESDAAFEQAARIAPDNPDLKFTRARTYLEAKRNQQLARQLLEEYLKAPLTPDNTPRAEAERLLRSIPRS
jgi:cytochrome c-type biogenesis protein CcmH/NrfG